MISLLNLPEPEIDLSMKLKITSIKVSCCFQ